MPNNAEIAALNELLVTMNNPDIVGVEVPKGVNTTAAEALAKAQAAFESYTPEQLAAAKFVPTDSAPGTGQVWIETRANPPGVPGPAGEPRRLTTQKLFFTGRLKSGKDHAATAAGAKIFGFADPLYAMASFYFGVEVSGSAGKDIPGIRECLQTFGQWGRGMIGEKYPVTPTRALFVAQVREDGNNGRFGHTEVDWRAYGLDADIWLDACVARANDYLAENPNARIAVTNCRFANEFKCLADEGFQHWHVMCSPKTWAERLALSKLTPESPAVKDVSESLAAKLDQDVIKQVSAQKQGPMLRAIWADATVPRPSERLHTIQSFLKSL